MTACRRRPTFGSEADSAAPGNGVLFRQAAGTGIVTAFICISYDWAIAGIYLGEMIVLALS